MQESQISNFNKFDLGIPHNFESQCFLHKNYLCHILLLKQIIVPMSTMYSLLFFNVIIANVNKFDILIYVVPGSTHIYIYGLYIYIAKP